MTPDEATPMAAPPKRPGRRSWRVILILVATGLVVAGAAGVGLWEVSSSPVLCNSCHIMKPYVAAWKVSKHNQVACVQCHYPPGLRDTLWVKYQAVTQVVKWATQTYSSKPFAEVEDGSCLRSGCHDRGLLQGKVAYKRGVMFDHKPHLDQAHLGRRLRCTSCHTQTVVATHIEVTDSACFLCHFKGFKSAREIRPIGGCVSCHQAPKGDITVGSVRFNHEEMVSRGVACQRCHLNVVEGDGEAPRERCLTCHNQPEKLARFADTAFVHDFHVADKNIECGRCHTAIKHRLPPPIGLRKTEREPDAPRLAARSSP
jgi:nitrate/TMAO reductase-like tetraheme cytochrome c subunit